MCTTEEVKDIHAINLDEPQFDKDTYWGRARNIFQLYNPLHIFASSETLEDAKCLVCKHKCGQPLPDCVDEDELWEANRLYESAYNSETGEKISFLARPSARVLMNSILAGGLLAFYNNNPATVAWHWLNQTYNTFVNFATREDEHSLTDNQLLSSYVLATGAAVGTALGLNHLLKHAAPLHRRFVPFAAVTAAHIVGTPLLKAQLLKNGTPIYDDANSKLGYSKRAAQASISGTTLGKIFYAAPPLLLTPFFLDHLESRGTLCRYPWLSFPASFAVAALCLTVLSPLALACLAQQAHFPYHHLEPEVKDYLCKKFHNRPPSYVYYHNEF